MDRFAGLSVAGVVLCLVGMVPPKPAIGPCERPIHFAERSTAVEFDLDCDGTRDELRVEVGQDSLGVSRHWLLLRGSRAEIPLEGSVEIVGAGDLNGDALDDILLLGMSPGVATPLVVISTESGGVAARFSSPEMARSMNLVFNEAVYADCPSIIRSARFLEAPEGLRLLLRAGYEQEVTCEMPPQAWTLVAVDTTLILAPDE